jgi:hypothetical protein
MIREQKRLSAAWRRFQFEFLEGLGFFWLISKISFLNLKEPWNTLYKRSQYLKGKNISKP